MAIYRFKETGAAGRTLKASSAPAA